MKTKTQNKKSGLKNRSEQVSTSGTASNQTERKDNRLPINREQRKKNRTLSTPNVLNLLIAKLPDVYRLAEVVGKWVWVQFSEVPAAEIRKELAQLGFHWNRGRQSWQHPCGLNCDEAALLDPRKIYRSYFPADVKPA